jgi:hypothetical protein
MIQLCSQKRASSADSRAINEIARATSGADGTFHIAGEISAEGLTDSLLRASAPGRASTSANVNFDREGHPRFTDLNRRAPLAAPVAGAAAGPPIRGVVLNDQDQPVEGCLVSAGLSRDPVRSGADGAI